MRAAGWLHWNVCPFFPLRWISCTPLYSHSNEFQRRQATLVQGEQALLRVVACKKETMQLLYPSWHKGLISIESNIIRLMYRVCMKCALCNLTPRCVRFIKKERMILPLPPVYRSHLWKRKPLFCVFAMKRHQQQKNMYVPSSIQWGSTCMYSKYC